MYVVMFGWDSRGRPRNRYFDSIEAATKAANEHYARTGVILAIEHAQR